MHFTYLQIPSMMHFRFHVALRAPSHENCRRHVASYENFRRFVASTEPPYEISHANARTEPHEVEMQFLARGGAGAAPCMRADS